MCMSSAPAKLTDTIVFAGKCPDGDHLLGYQNTVESFSKDSVNSMILPIPSAVKMSRLNMLDTSECPDMLKNIAEQLFATLSFNSRGMMKGFDSRSVEIFKSGNYTVILAENGSDIPNALKQISENERPNIRQDLCDTLTKYYPGWWMACCIWSGNAKIKNHPILWKYTPINKNYLFMPGLDSHDGGPPDVNKLIKRDHTFIVGREPEEYSSFNSILNKLPTHLKEVMPKNFFGKKNSRNCEQNCDWFVKSDGSDQRLIEAKPIGYVKSLFGDTF